MVEAGATFGLEAGAQTAQAVLRGLARPNAPIATANLSFAAANRFGPAVGRSARMLQAARFLGGPTVQTLTAGIGALAQTRGQPATVRAATVASLPLAALVGAVPGVGAFLGPLIPALAPLIGLVDAQRTATQVRRMGRRLAPEVAALGLPAGIESAALRNLVIQRNAELPRVRRVPRRLLGRPVGLVPNPLKQRLLEAANVAHIDFTNPFEVSRFIGSGPGADEQRRIAAERIFLPVRRRLERRARHPRNVPAIFQRTRRPN